MKFEVHNEILNKESETASDINRQVITHLFYDQINKHSNFSSSQATKDNCCSINRHMLTLDW